MNTSQTLVNLTKALIAFQSKVPPIDKNSQGYGYRYASLDHILAAVRAPLGECGLVVTQVCKAGLVPNGVTIVTRLMHTSGEWIEGELTIQSDKSGAQALGASITYGRRYSITAILGIAADEDDDARSTEKAREATPGPMVKNFGVTPTSVKVGISASHSSLAPQQELMPTAPRDYVMKTGKSKGTRLGSMLEEDVIGYKAWVDSKKSKGDNINGALLSDYQAMSLFINEFNKSILDRDEDIPPITDDEIPF